MQYFHFERLIRKYSRPFDVYVPATGTYDAGRYVDGKAQKASVTGAILSRYRGKQFQQGGTIETQDRVLYMLSPIDKALLGAEVHFEGNTYQIAEDRQTGNESFTGVYAYTLRWVSAFDE